jgi:serine protease AprX
MGKFSRRQFVRALGLGLGAGALAPLAGAGGDLLVPRAGAAPQARVTLDPAMPVHPCLQYGAQIEPNRRVRIVVQKTHPAADSKGIARSAGAELAEEFTFIKSLVLEVPQRAVLGLARNPHVLYISPDAPAGLTAVSTAALKTTHQAASGVTQGWNGAYPATGKGVTVAVVDSGVAISHAALTNRVVPRTVISQPADDPHGHGTHVVGTITGRDPQGRYFGVAPDARVVSVRVSDRSGACSEADLLRGLQWCYDNRAAYNIRAVNVSVSSAVAGSYTVSPIAAAAEQLWLAGVVVVAAAGNRGAGLVNHAPGHDPHIITVGALDHNATAGMTDDRLADFSGRGAIVLGNHRYYKPDLVAPGRKIVAPLSSASSELAQRFPDRITDSCYIRLSGTSMAAPIVTGMVALLLERHPGLRPNQVRWLLQNGMTGYPGQADQAGAASAANALRLAATYGANTPEAKSWLPLNAGINPATGTSTWTQAYWDQAYWDQAYWDQAYWDQAYWDNATSYD